MPTTKIEDVNISILDALVQTGIAPSKGQAKTLIAQGGITLNDEKVTDENLIINEEIAILEDTLVVRRGKKKYHIGIYE